MTQFRILVGSYTEEIYTLLFDDVKGSLEVVSTVNVGYHPSWITFHPNDRSIVFTGLEQSDGTVVAMRFDGVGKGVVVGKTESGGRDPCSLLATKDELLIANYSSGTLGFVSLEKSAPFISTSSQTTKLQLAGYGPNKARQEGSHPHQLVILDETNELLVPDLGADRLCRFKKASNGTWTLSGHIQYELGGGPRHVAYHNGELFTLLELSSKVARHTFPPPPALPKFITSTPTMSSPLPQPNDMLAAEILIPKPNSSFPTPYIYISNRNDPSPEGDIVSIFDFTSDPNKLQLIAEVRTRLKHVRGIFFGGEDDKYLVAGGVNGGGVKVFERVDDGKGLKEVAKNESIIAPTGFLWK
ncbi:6-phosphogluconolactonase [Leucoagaricus sp. SymC.cos]|nr:6-phosphogluconolactonase [Leucoagaricus sp. SymC.cos]